MRMTQRLACVSAVLAMASPTGAVAGGQAKPGAQKPARAATDDSVPDDIVVEGYRQRPDIKTTASTPTISTTNNRIKYGYSERIAKCAARSKLANLSRLRAVVDGEFGTADQMMAQDRLKRIYITCSESPSLLSFTKADQSDLELMSQFGEAASARDPNGAESVNSFSNDPFPLGRSVYDRGAFTIQALKMFAPDMKLTRTDTNNPAVQSRFNLREVPRNHHRLPEDYRYFEVAVCMVRVEPRLAVRLAMTDGSAKVGDVQAALIDRARVCVGGAKNVQVDPTQFRLYIADAVYRWAVAARGVDTLIPDHV